MPKLAITANRHGRMDIPQSQEVFALTKSSFNFELIFQYGFETGQYPLDYNKSQPY